MNTIQQLEAVVVASALDDMYRPAESRLAVVSRSLPRRYRHLSKINVASALMLYRNNFCIQSGYFTISNGIFKFNFLAIVVSEISGVHKLFSCLRNLAPSYLMNRYAVHAALLSLGRQREMRYLHHYATTNSLPCHFVASWRLSYTLEHIMHTSTLVTVFTVRVGEHNFIVLTHLLTLGGPAPRWRHLTEKLLYPKRVIYHI